MHRLDPMMNKTKGNLFYKKGSGFLGPLICNISHTWDETIPTAQTDGFRITWNPAFYESLDLDSRIFVLAHEAYHIGMLHVIRRGVRDPKRWNQAADYVVNGILINDGFKCNVPHLYDKKYDGKSVEEVYDLLKDVPLPKLPMGGLEPNDVIEPTGDKAAVAEAHHDIVQKVLAASAQARIGNNAGDIPGETKLAIDKFLRVVLPWEAILQNFFTAICDNTRSYQRPSRRYHDPLLPGRTGQNGLEHLIYFLDISGSISDKEIVRFNTEVKYIKDTFNPVKLTLVTFDTKIHDVYVFDKHDTFDKIEVIGRGGTDLREVVKFANKEMPTAVVVFSDMCVTIPTEQIKSPVIWVCVNNPRITVPYGKLIYLNE